MQENPDGRILWAMALLALSACGGGGSVAVGALGTSTPSTPTSTASAIDPTRLPLGDGKFTTTGPQVGYLYVCALASSSNPPGKAPWISADGSTWDSTAKISVQGMVTWASSFVASLAGAVRSLSGNGLPDHTTGVFPIASTDPARVYDGNPNSITAQAFAWSLPANPVVASRPACTGLGAIGVLLSGARLYNASDADGRDAVAHEVQDSCKGHPQGQGQYHYHSVTHCLQQAGASGQHSPLVGYIADGFGLYGNLGEGGKALTNADLDECHGHSHALSVNGATVTQYHYHATQEFPYTVGCFKGTPVSLR